jgi:hypothetical protein
MLNNYVRKSNRTYNLRNSLKFTQTFNQPQLRYYAAGQPTGARTGAPDKYSSELDDLLYYNEGDDGEEEEVKDPWLVGPFNGGEPSLEYHIEPGSDPRPMLQKLKKDLDGTIDDVSEKRYLKFIRRFLSYPNVN